MQGSERARNSGRRGQASRGLGRALGKAESLYAAKDRDATPPRVMPRPPANMA